MSSSRWQLVGRIAQLRTANLTASVDPENPAAGLRIDTLCGCPMSRAALFGIQIEPSPRPNESAMCPAPPIDCFVRGDDLVATYPETAERPFRAQIYWRSIDNGEGSDPHPKPIAALELIVSVQTSRLDTETALAVCTTLGAVETWRMLDAGEDCAQEGDFPQGSVAPRAADSPGCCLIRPIGSGPSYIELVHPSDFRQTSFEWSDDSAPVVWLAHRLFAERLEKGVILRSRIRGLFVPRSHDTELARNEFRRFASSEPPLTT